MARITAEALDEVERTKLGRRSRLERPHVDVGGAVPGAAVVVIAAGAIVLAAPDLVPGPGHLLGGLALVLGGWLARGRPADVAAERATLARREAELNRVLVAIALRGHDALADIARRRGEGPDALEPRPAGGAPGEERGHRLHAVGGSGDESLEPDADDELGAR